jgi:mannose/cellobiose epimerase-like protein (N-acyl-D-glucosamine 2-epimerase family)
MEKKILIALALGGLFSMVALQAKEGSVPSVSFERVQGIVAEADPATRCVTVTLPGGETQTLRIASNAYLHGLKDLDERQRLLDPTDMQGFQKGVRIVASGLVYSDSPELVAKEVAFLSGTEGEPVFEQADWWSSQARDLADFWIKTQFGEGDIGDPVGYRTNISKTGTKRPESVNLQETATISRLIYGLSSIYILNGSPRVLEAARQLVRYQRERMRIESPDGRYIYWLHAIRAGQPVLPSLFPDDAGTIPLYEQIYCLAGLTQFYRVTGDPEILSDIEKTVRFMDDFYWDYGSKNPLEQGYFSHIHSGTFRVADATGQNALKKNWNSVGDHLPAYLENLYLGTRNPKYLERLRQLGTLIATHFPDPASPFVNERFDAAWKPDHSYAWQQNRGVVGHNLKIAWCLTRLYHLTGDKKFLEVAKECGDEMLTHGQDTRRGGWYDVIERDADPVTGRHELVWHDRKAWWQQEQGILGNYILFAETQDPKYLNSARAGAGFYNLVFPDHDDGDVFFDVQADGTPYLLGDRADKGSHSKSGYHNMELTYFAHLYTNLLINKRPVTLHFAPCLEAGGTTFQVQPISLPPGRIKIVSATVDGDPYTDFDANALSVKLPKWTSPELLTVTLAPK